MPVLLMGCATSQTIHWEEDTPAAATQVAELSAEHKATIRDLSGARFWGRDVTILGDAVRWTRTRDGEPQVMPLAEVASIEFVTGRHVGKGAWIGALFGAAGGGLFAGIICISDDCSFPGTGPVISTFAFIGAGIGAIWGGLTGAYTADKVIFVPQE